MSKITKWFTEDWTERKLLTLVASGLVLLVLVGLGVGALSDSLASGGTSSHLSSTPHFSAGDRAACTYFVRARQATTDGDYNAADTYTSDAADSATNPKLKSDLTTLEADVQAALDNTGVVPGADVNAVQADCDAIQGGGGTQAAPAPATPELSFTCSVSYPNGVTTISFTATNNTDHPVTLSGVTATYSPSGFSATKDQANGLYGPPNNIDPGASYTGDWTPTTTAGVSATSCTITSWEGG